MLGAVIRRHELGYYQFRIGPWCGVLSLLHGWMRLFGWGFSWKNTHKVSMTFSERELGHGLRLGRFLFRILRRNRNWLTGDQRW